ncbi:MAG: glycosyltransferase family 4 protein [Methylococcaceae bacterium]|nr:glycosyltransferase family 4 protein [Methylococcaceae bacterium]
MKKLLIIGYVWPEPKSSAAGSRMMELIELFHANHWRIVFASASALSKHRADLSAFGVQEQPIILNDSSFNDFIGELNPAVVLFDRFFTEEQFGWRVEQMCPDALRILDTEDLHSLRHVRQQYLRQGQKQAATEDERQRVGPVLIETVELYQRMTEDDMAQREIASIYRCDLSLIISQFEMNLLADCFSIPKPLLQYCPFLKNTMQVHGVLPGFSDRQHFISIGNFRHEPNWDAVLYLKHAIWPFIRSSLPDVELHVYGAYTPPKAMQLHSPKQGFYIKGWADDALQVMRRARVCLAPLRFGAGIKGKLMDAMRVGTPSVTTSIGAEAMCGNRPWGGQIENETQAFAEAAVQLYVDEVQWLKAQQRGFGILTHYFAQDDYAHLLIERIFQLKENLAQERQQNFVGTLLRHHFHKSTQYMSRWIEAKNKNP